MMELKKKKKDIQVDYLKWVNSCYTKSLIIKTGKKKENHIGRQL